MNQSKNDKNTVDDQLADFTDNILDGKIDNTVETPLAPDLELRALEQTALRLKNAFHEEGPSKDAIQRMRKNITMQWRQQKNRQSTSAWKNFWLALNPFKQKWYSQRSRRRLSMAISLLLLIALMLISIPILNGYGTDQPATSIQNLNVSLVIVFCGLILLAIWISRRKS